ncbi:FecR family protein [uncultured Bacteroides sp.]|uniref:FecR family protein n=1 Tax=uncultured Bacteroides sp. TaxID=162156 RepID=UPI0025E7E317|nr:FecR domain-containing protein [uncultured Bacteroides sp.]
MHVGKEKHVDEEIIRYIEERMNNDVAKLLENKPLDFGKQTLPEFNEYTLYNKIAVEVNKAGRQSFKLALGWVAVVLVLLSNAAYFAYQYMDKPVPEYREVSVLKGDKMLVLLSDGSRVWLNADSKLTYPEQFVTDERKVTLEGEAYFEVKSNPDNPFYVTAGGMQIRVTGTCFNVMAYPTDSEVVTTLDEGQISIGKYDKNATFYTMRPGQTAVYSKSANTCKVLTNEYYKDASGWRDGRLIFRNSSLEAVLKVLSRQFDVSFSIENDKVRSFTYNLACKSNDLGNALKMIQSITPVKIEKKSEYTYVIK